jgi:hypothetical protein
MLIQIDKYKVNKFYFYFSYYYYYFLFILLIFFIFSLNYITTLKRLLSFIINIEHLSLVCIDNDYNKMKFIITLILITIISIDTLNCQMYWYQLYDTLSYTISSYKPPTRKDSSIAYDRERNRIIIFGGCQVKSEYDRFPILFDDTWEFNLNTCK